MRYILLVKALFLTFSVSQAQSLYVGTPSLEDYYRQKQLAGELDLRISFVARPLFPSSLKWGIPGTVDSLLGTGRDSDASARKAWFSLLPMVLEQRYHSEPTYGWNDGSMIPAKGYQAKISAGVYAKAGPLSLQFQPDFVYAENKKFDIVRSHFGGSDLPARFGDKAFSKATWGQSSLRLTFDPISFGVSNENLWWGPGIMNSLLMSNTATGFKHLTINTTRPLDTPIGSLEGQIIAGRLESSGFDISSNESRYLSGIILSYQPKWVPGLFLGLTRSFQSYLSDVDTFGDYFPLFTPFQKKNDMNQDDLGRDGRDQLASLFGRWVMPESKAEVYIEYGLNDHSFNTRDFLMSPEHSRSYLLGIRKLIPYQRTQGKYIQFGAEITRMEQSIDRIIRDAGEWYNHSPIIHGYTHSGEVLGAGIGPGGNSQILDVRFVENIKSLGLSLLRYEHNGDFANYKDYSPWIDFSIMAHSTWMFRNIRVNTNIIGIKSINHQWRDGIDGRPKQNVFNINAQLGITYSF